MSGWRVRPYVMALTFVISASLVNAAEEKKVDANALRVAAKSATWSLRLPKEDKVIYRGLVNYDNAGTNSAQMMYPAPNVAGFLAAIFTHGALVESQKNAEKERLQKVADKAVTPYQDVLSDYTYKNLMQRALEKTSMGTGKKIIDASEKSESDWVIESTPVFFLTQDQSAIVLDNLVTIYAPNAPSTPIYQNVIRVISKPREETNIEEFWKAGNGTALKNESVSLVVQSLTLVYGELTIEPNIEAPQKTFRYPLGNTEKMERGQLISEQCDRLVIRTLRGSLMSIPPRQGAITDNKCG